LNKRILTQVETSWDLQTIVDLIKEGSDVKLACAYGLNDLDEYTEYYWTRITEKEMCWKLISLEGTEPKKPSKDLLDSLVKCRFERYERLAKIDF
jgi:hypothetical protein